ncbi:HAD-IA family hydrolase [Streptacidiphilus sp. N1-10]|uniref:HAD-IA family hydrolase n=1 Tax=Streptacidiphilus jeojiensis TaxID=3229225 RepID=A0ABV6XWL6_9ACTN
MTRSSTTELDTATGQVSRHLQLVEWLRSTRAVAFDFDGPVCRLFAGYSAPGIAAELADMLPREELPGLFKDPGPDPHALLVAVDQAIDRLGSGDLQPLVVELEERLSKLEVEATVSAAPTAGLPELVGLLRAQGAVLAIASNNSAAAVTAYLDRTGLTECFFGPVLGRDRDPRRMKPSPFVLERVVSESGVALEEWVFIGDSLADLRAARYAGMRFVGFAPRASRREELLLEGAVQVIGGYAELLSDLNDSVASPMGSRW